MAHAIVGKWGKSLAIRGPLDVARTMGLRKSEPVEIEENDGELHVRRKTGKIDDDRRLRALAAVEEMRRDAKNFDRFGLTIRELIDEGRKY